jgi:hypothetical protein
VRDAHGVEALEIDDAFETELESELQLVRDAVLLVASGVARRVIVANLQHGRVIALPAREFAADVGIEIDSLPTADDLRIDLVAERASPPIAEAPA